MRMPEVGVTGNICRGVSGHSDMSELALSRSSNRWLRLPSCCCCTCKLHFSPARLRCKVFHQHAWLKTLIQDRAGAHTYRLVQHNCCVSCTFRSHCEGYHYAYPLVRPIPARPNQVHAEAPHAYEAVQVHVQNAANGHATHHVCCSTKTPWCDGANRVPFLMTAGSHSTGGDIVCTQRQGGSPEALGTECRQR